MHRRETLYTATKTQPNPTPSRQTYFASETVSYASHPENWLTLSNWAAAANKLFIPSVGPGWVLIGWFWRFSGFFRAGMNRLIGLLPLCCVPFPGMTTAAFGPGTQQPQRAGRRGRGVYMRGCRGGGNPLDPYSAPNHPLPNQPTKQPLATQPPPKGTRAHGRPPKPPAPTQSQSSASTSGARAPRSSRPNFGWTPKRASHSKTMG